MIIKVKAGRRYSSCEVNRVLLLWIASNLTLVALLITKFHEGTMMVIG